MKNNNLFLFGLMAALTLSCSGCSTSGSTSGSSSGSITGSTSGSTSGSTDVSIVQDDESLFESTQNAYSDIISNIIAGYKDQWENTSPEDLDVSEVHSYVSDKMGFISTDIDGDGIDELIIGENVGDNGTMIYDMYTANDSGEICHVICGGERDVYYLTDDNTIQEVGSNSADDSFTKEYDLEDGALKEITTSTSGGNQTLKLDLIADYLNT